ncbi:MAG: Transcriptional regulator, TetR family [Verrucomicrobiaceae bacterium]|nr:Transcriptional regulator, TetR family [Verrucomicrobiaceae bacterium]
MKTRSTTLELPETKRKLVDAGVSLMRTKGYNATTVDNICGEAGVTKGGFFHYFTSKEDLAKAAAARFREEQAQVMNEAAFRKLEDPLDRVYGRLEFVEESKGGVQVTRGCLIGDFAQELSFTHPELRSVCEEAFAAMALDFEKDLAEAKARHAPDAGFDPKSVAMLYVSIVQGSMMMAKAADSNAVLKANIAQLRRYVESLFGAGRP